MMLRADLTDTVKFAAGKFVGMNEIHGIVERLSQHFSLTEEPDRDREADGVHFSNNGLIGGS